MKLSMPFHKNSNNTHKKIKISSISLFQFHYIIWNNFLRKFNKHTIHSNLYPTENNEHNGRC